MASSDGDTNVRPGLPRISVDGHSAWRNPADSDGRVSNDPIARDAKRADPWASP